jgi:hypothetical protein
MSLQIKRKRRAEQFRHYPVIEADPAVAFIITANEILHICISMCSIFHLQRQQFSVIPSIFLDWSRIQGVIENIKSLSEAQTTNSIGQNALQKHLRRNRKCVLVSFGSLHRVTETFSWLYGRCGLGVINLSQPKQCREGLRRQAQRPLALKYNLPFVDRPNLISTIKALSESLYIQSGALIFLIVESLLFIIKIFPNMDSSIVESPIRIESPYCY